MGAEEGKLVGVVGGGSWGTALAQILGANGHEVLLWLRDEGVAAEINRAHTNKRYLPDALLSPSVRASTALARVGQECQVIFVVVPSHGLRVVARELGDHLNGSHILIHGVKGIEPGTFKRMSEILREETATRKIGVLSGPNLAKEVAANNPSATVVASRFEEVIEAGRRLLWSKTFRVYGSDDIVGTEIGGALKNIMAIASGIAQGLGFGQNTMALLLTRGLAEIARIGVAQGAKLQTFQGLSGIGDLMATCFSPLSRNFQVGLRMAGGERLDEIIASMNQVAEGVKTTRTVHEWAKLVGVYMPLTEGVYRMLFEIARPEEVLSGLMDITRYVYEFEAPALEKA